MSCPISHECEFCVGCQECYAVACEELIDSERTDMAGITKDTFQSMSVEAKLDVLFDYLVDIQEMAPKRVRDRDIRCAKQVAKCEARFSEFDVQCDSVKKALKIRMYLNTSAALIGGFIGGWSAVWTAFKFSILGG